MLSLISTERCDAIFCFIFHSYVQRAGFDGAPMHEDRVKAKGDKGAVPTSATPAKKHVTFVNEQDKPEMEKAELFYEDSFWAKLGAADPPQAVNSYEGQVWNVKVEGKIVKTFVVSKEAKQVYTI